MRTRKNVLLLFSKVPEVGKVKTRLSTLKDGRFTPEVASALYHCMLFDVVEICCAALADLEQEAREWADENPEDTLDTYELVISTTPASNVPVMRKLFSDAGEWPRELVVIADEGSSFDEHYNHAFAQVWERGADTILSMGADMPALTKRDVINGFVELQRIDDLQLLAETEECAEVAADYANGGIVLSPDQEMGVSIVGWTRATEFDHTGVFYNPDGYTVLPAYIHKARERGLPAVWLPPVPDVDTMADLMHNVTLVEALCYCAEHDDVTPPWRTRDALAQIGWSEVRVAPNELRDPRDEIDAEQ